MDSNKTYMVTNRSSSMVVYSIPDDRIRREFQPGETLKVKHSELEKLTYQPGGKTLISEFLLIKDEEAIADLAVRTEPEYYMTEPEVIELILNGSYEAWLDCLDFAPTGVIDLVKKLSVSVPLNDVRKREALKKKTDFDVSAAIEHLKDEQEDENESVDAAPQRRVKAETTGTTRRTLPNYNVVSKQG